MSHPEKTDELLKDNIIINLSRLLIDGGTTVLRSVFDGFHPPVNLAADLNANLPILNNLFKRKVLHKPQWDLLFHRAK